MIVLPFKARLRPFATPYFLIGYHHYYGPADYPFIIFLAFYCGYLSAQTAVEILPVSITAAVSGAVQSSENRMARLLFKLAVEMSMMMNVVAAGADLDEVNLRRLRGKCVEDVKKSIGAINFDEVLKFQRGE